MKKILLGKMISVININEQAIILMLIGLDVEDGYLFFKNIKNKEHFTTGIELRMKDPARGFIIIVTAILIKDSGKMIKGGD